MYRYEMHCHSLLSGGGEAIERHVDHLSALGWAGMVITNHFFWGDNRVSRELPWNEFVRAYEQDWLTGKAYARSLDFDVIFGVEEHIGGGKEILIYGLEPDFFYANPVLREHRLEDYSRLVRAAGGVIVQAHPFRDRRYIPEVGPVADLSLVDGIEVFNAGN
ncbi:MAG: PHP domain-containing protein, partial [Oscillospiraceae bacterium]|nr:PHP domain-containing protein [Oscillospiraceae bacterium]